MNHKLTLSSTGLEALQTRFGLQVAACLNEQAAALPHDVSERLRFARERAIERARLARVAAVPVAGASAQVNASGSSASLTVSSGGQPGGWRRWLSAVMPLAALVAGLITIQHFHEKAQISAAAEIDAALLADDLPPAAYSDPGFAEFLKSPRN